MPPTIAPITPTPTYPGFPYGEQTESELPDDIVTRYRAIAQAIASIDAGFRELDAERAGMKGAEVTPALAAKAEKLRTRRMQLLQSKAGALRDLVEWEAAASPMLKRVGEDAAKKFEAVQIDVRRRLVSIGYHDTPPGEFADLSRIMPGWVWAHPEVRAAKARMADTEALVSHRPNNYAPQLDAVNAELESIRGELLRGV
jgi:hypothetical protein